MQNQFPEMEKDTNDDEEEEEEQQQQNNKDDYNGLLPKMYESISLYHVRNQRPKVIIMIILVLLLSLVFWFRIWNVPWLSNFESKDFNQSSDNDDPWQIAITTSKPIQIFILAGQSNMVGFGSVQHLQSLIQQSGNFTHLMQNNHQWIIQPKVRVVTPAMEQFQGESLTVGLGFNRSYFGPELGFGTIMSEIHPEHRIVLIKAAWDGYSLSVHFRPPSAGIGNYTNYRHQKLTEEKYGVAYRQMMYMVNQTKATLTGVPYEIKGLVWFQGWADQSPERSSEYKSNLVHLIQDVRNTLNTPNLPVVIGECGQYRGKIKDKELLERVRDAQKAVTEVFPETSKLVDARMFTHEDRTENYNAGFHYHGHADTYYEIGVAFGRAMLELLNE